jgi:asparagine synthetase B (glutamine-hydrolysing)
VPDERYARYAAKKLGVPLRGLQISQGNIAESVDWALNLQDEPLGMVSFFMLAHLVAAAKEHGRILMTGDGGDEVFLGYGKAADWLAPASMNAERATWSVGLVEPSWMSVWGEVGGKTTIVRPYVHQGRSRGFRGKELRLDPLFWDWDLLAWARSLPPDRLLENGTMKSLLKVQLVGWRIGLSKGVKLASHFALDGSGQCRIMQACANGLAGRIVSCFEIGCPCP